MSSYPVSERPRPRGRYAADDLTARRDAVVVEAAKVFLELGFSGASFDVIARRASVSPKTIYAWFGGKAGLFAAVMERMGREQLMSGLEDILRRPDPSPEVLRAFALRLLETVLSPDSIALQRAIIAEAGRLPEVAETFYEAGPKRAIAVLAAYLRDEAAREKLAVPNPWLTAETFVGAIEGELLRRTLLGVAPEPNGDELERHVEEVLTRFRWLPRPTRATD